MTDRERLIELLTVTLTHGNDKTIILSGAAELIADYLIENGVTFAPANNVGRWIPVSERLPEQGQEVIVYSGGALKPQVYCYLFWNPNYDSWARVTHWMPLPEPPGEG